MEPIDPPISSRWPREKIHRKLLELDTRRRIWQRIREAPGIHLRGLARDLEMPIGTLEHHLHLLERYEVIVSHREARRRSFYPRSTVEPKDLSALHYLTQPQTGRILRELLAEPELDARELARRAELEAPRATYYLGRLSDAGLVERWTVGRHTIYQLSDPPRMERLLEGDPSRVPSDAFQFLLDRVAAHHDPASAAMASPRPSSRPTS